MSRRSRSPLWPLALALVACGGGTDPPADVVDDLAPPPDIDGPQEVVETAWAPLTLAERGYEELRVIIHIHSAYSHDGCDDEGLDADGLPDWTCVRRMKAALCRERVAVAFMTDHPSHMRDQPFSDLLYAETDAGDELVLHEGEPFAVRYRCPTGQGGPDGRVVLVPGFEGTHTMPIGLRRHLDNHAHYGVSLKDSTDPALIDDLAADVRGRGGLLTVAHSEQDDLAASVIAAHDIPAMELYNFHANFNEVLGDDLAAAIFALEDFLDPAAPIPHPDLVALVMLASYPTAALSKWREVSFVRPITAFAGSDVHENVLLPAICASPGVCDGLAFDYPNLVAFLETGGPVVHSDGDRIDSYGRVFRWVQNRLWVRPGEASLAGAEAALEAGRNVVVFEVLGDAPGVALLALTGDEAAPTYHDTGATVRVDDGAVLWARSPDLPAPGRNARWTSGEGAELEATVWRTDADGSTAALTWSEPGTWVSLPLDRPGAYQLEVTVVPRHLVDELGPASALAERTFRWVETNAIRVE